MKKFLLPLLALTLLSPAQENSAPAEETEKKPEKPQFILDLEALSREDAGKYFQFYQRADMLFKQKRIFECLEAIEEIDKIYDKNPASLNLKGACYVEFRNFEKARLAFGKALKANEGNFNVRFNLSEIEFVTKNYAECLKQLKELEAEAADNENFANMLPLVRFKMLLCMLKTDQVDEAKKIVAGTDFLDDSPLFYYGNAALEYFAGKGPEAEVWLARAGRIFRDAASIAPWQDTLIEYGYIKSFYGGDLEVETISPAATGAE